MSMPEKCMPLCSKAAFVSRIDLVPMTVALGNFMSCHRFCDTRLLALIQLHKHPSRMVPPRSPLAVRFCNSLPLSHSVSESHHRLRRRTELGGIGVFDAAKVTCCLQLRPSSGMPKQIRNMARDVRARTAQP